MVRAMSLRLSVVVFLAAFRCSDGISVSLSSYTTGGTGYSGFDAVTVSWNFVGGESIPSTVWINLMTQQGTPSCGYGGYTQAYVQGGSVAILQTQVATSASGTFTWNIANHAYESTTYYIQVSSFRAAAEACINGALTGSYGLSSGFTLASASTTTESFIWPPDASSGSPMATVNLGQHYVIEASGLRGPPFTPAHTYYYYLVVTASTTDFVNCYNGVTCWTVFPCGSGGAQRNGVYPWLHVGELIGSNLSAWMDWQLDTTTQACQGGIGATTGVGVGRYTDPSNPTTATQTGLVYWTDPDVTARVVIKIWDDTAGAWTCFDPENDGCDSNDNTAYASASFNVSGTPSPTHSPTRVPTLTPTTSPTRMPTHAPSHAPTNTPTRNPTHSPTRSPTFAPTPAPTITPTRTPTRAPTSTPTNGPTEAPTHSPTNNPTFAPTLAPTATPTRAPTPAPTTTPTRAPTRAPTSTPTFGPTATPSHAPTNGPTFPPTASPTDTPTFTPTFQPTTSPTARPTHVPTLSPTDGPTMAPTRMPTASPTHSPTLLPTASPTVGPTSVPTLAPSATPSMSPTHAPTAVPTAAPSEAPTVSPTDGPTRPPTHAPTSLPTPAPTFTPTATPTRTPTNAPSARPTESPTLPPSAAPTVAPTTVPTAQPSVPPTDSPSHLPTPSPTFTPTIVPSATPTFAPSVSPTAPPTVVVATTFGAPTPSPTATPTAAPTLAFVISPPNARESTDSSSDFWWIIVVAILLCCLAMCFAACARRRRRRPPASVLDKSYSINKENPAYGSSPAFGHTVFSGSHAVVPNATYVPLSDEPPTYATVGAGSMYATQPPPLPQRADAVHVGRGPATINAVYDPLAPAHNARGSAVVNETYATGPHSTTQPVSGRSGGGGGATVITNGTYDPIEQTYMTVEDERDAVNGATSEHPSPKSGAHATLRIDRRGDGGDGGDGGNEGPSTHFYPASVWHEPAEPLYSDALVSMPKPESPRYAVTLPFSGGVDGARGGGSDRDETAGASINHYAAGSTAYASSEDPHDAGDYASAADVQGDGPSIEAPPSVQVSKESPIPKPRRKVPPPKPPRSTSATIVGDDV